MSQLTHETVVLAYDQNLGWITLNIDNGYDELPRFRLQFEIVGDEPLFLAPNQILERIVPVIPPENDDQSKISGKLAYRWAGLNEDNRRKLGKLILKTIERMDKLTSTLASIDSPPLPYTFDYTKTFRSISEQILSASLSGIKALLDSSDLTAGRRRALINTKAVSKARKQRISLLEAELTELKHKEKKYGGTND